MERVRHSRWGRRIAGWPSSAVVGASVLAIVAASLVLPEWAVWWFPLVAFAPVLAYCLLRTTRRWDAAFAWLAPGTLSSVSHEVVGVPRWTIALPVLLIALAVLAVEDRAERRARAQPA